jgi:hypothetical protein
MARVSEMQLVNCSSADVLMQRFMFDSSAQPLFQVSSSDVLSLYVNISLLLLFVVLLLFSYFLITRLMFFNILFMFVFLFC